MIAYLPRILDTMIQDRLGSSGAIVVEGARATGKTFTASHHAASAVRVDAELEKQPLLRSHPETLLSGKAPRLIDEWQILPELWNMVRREVDDRQQKGQFILTGSAIPQDDITRHSGAGRFSRLRMRPMTLFESQGSVHPIRISDLLHGSPIVQGKSTFELRSVIDTMIKGGWPALHGDNNGSVTWVRDYVDEMTRIDVALLDTGVRQRDPNKIARVMRSLARNVGAALRVSTIQHDTAGEEGSISREAIASYIDALQRVMILETLPAWQPHLRSKTELRTSPKLYFVDPSIGPATLRLTPQRLLKDLSYVGQVFENLVMRDVQVYAQVNNGNISYYRDNNGLEVDIILEGEDDAWIAMEIKLGQSGHDEAAKNLLRFRDKVDTGRMGSPQALAIITSGGYALTRPDGVHVIPIDLLSP
ncbi:MAG: ATP-binding protein [Ignavibacteriae bacterium]|nr:MAG: ATP-binding protein [Ignavibacteriota bacterium]